MTYIETKKAELREKLNVALSKGAYSLDGKLVPTSEGVEAVLTEASQFIDNLLNDIESRVVPKCIDNDCDNEGVVAERDSEGDWIPAPCQYCHQVRFPMRKAFQHLRTGVENEWRCECNTQLPYFGTKTVDGFIRCQNCKRVYTTTGELANNQ